MLLVHESTETIKETEIEPVQSKALSEEDRTTFLEKCCVKYPKVGRFLHPQSSRAAAKASRKREKQDAKQAVKVNTDLI
jgi:hypothetical protein